MKPLMTSLIAASHPKLSALKDLRAGIKSKEINTARRCFVLNYKKRRISFESLGIKFLPPFNRCICRISSRADEDKRKPVERRDTKTSAVATGFTSVA